MARTKQEIRDFLDRQVGQRVNPKAAPYDGQCVSLIKALFEFLGVPNPYAARGDAKDAADFYLREGIATNGPGWLQVAVNRDMGVINGVRYGHIWCDIDNEANYEQNGAIALRTTKNTISIKKAQQIVNLDKWVATDPVPQQDIAKSMYWRVLGREATQTNVDQTVYEAGLKGWDTVYNNLRLTDEAQKDWAWRNPDAVRALEKKAAGGNADVTQLLEAAQADLLLAQKERDALRATTQAQEQTIMELQAELDKAQQSDYSWVDKLQAWLRGVFK